MRRHVIAEVKELTQTVPLLARAVRDRDKIIVPAMTAQIAMPMMLMRGYPAHRRRTIAGALKMDVLLEPIELFHVISLRAYVGRFEVVLVIEHWRR
jgi:hypothetical protein